MIFKRFCPGVVVGAVVLSSVSFCYDPIPVYADFGNFASTYDFASNLTGVALDDAIDRGSVAGVSFCLGALFGIKYLDDLNNMVSSGAFEVSGQAMTFGYYYDDSGNRKKILAAAHKGSYPAAQQFPWVMADDFTIYLSSAYGASGVYTNNGTVVTGGYTWNAYSSGYFTNGSSISFNNGIGVYGGSNVHSPPPVVSASSAVGDYIRAFNNITNARRIMGEYVDVILPGDYDPVNTTPDEYLSDTLIPYVEINYPDCMFIFETAPDPNDPIYDSDDIVPGIPKGWTITNPDLPSIPDLDLELPTADFDELDPVEPITSHLSGVSFWWDLLETALVQVDVKSLWLAVAAIGLALFILWKLGG